jgi:hypothetical protein
LKNIGIRSIELFFRAGKSLLRLGSEFQGLSYDMTVSSTAIVFTRYILLEWLRRKANDPKTICKLFYVCCDDIQDIELCTALSSLVSIFMEGFRTETIKITNVVKTQLINWFVSQPALQGFIPGSSVGSLSYIFNSSIQILVNTCISLQ